MLSGRRDARSFTYIRPCHNTKTATEDNGFGRLDQ
jgi:hypothetical protein